jgi:hypothetical protein
MSETGAKQIAFVIEEDLCFVNQSTKCRGVNDAVSIALEIIARGRRNFGITSAA